MNMDIAVSSQNFRTITGHAGKTRRFIIYAATGDQVQEVKRLDLPKALSFHEFHGAGAHPIDGVEVIITASCGPGFARRLAARGIRIALAEEKSDPLAAARAYASGRLQAVDPATIPEHDHDHDHDHDQDPDHEH